MTKQPTSAAVDDEQETIVSLSDRLSRLQQRAAERSTDASRDDQLDEATVGGSAQAEEPAPPPRPPRGRPSNSVIEDAQLELLRMEQQGRFAKFPLTPESEYPSLLTRIPIFLPVPRSRQAKLLDADNALVFQTSWGTGRKHGPPLTVYDEDTLIALCRLRQTKLTGRPGQLPVPVAELTGPTTEDSVYVHVTQCMITDIQRECGDSDGGRNTKLRLESIKRLAAQVIEFERTSAQGVTRGTSIKLLEVLWESYKERAVLYVQFHPVMARWLEHEYTFINWAIRKQLTDTGKALHRFLASQPKQYEITVSKLRTTIGYQRDVRHLVADIKRTMTRLEELGWLDGWEVVGNGRRTPHKLIVNRR